jgi:hypothetical protein
MGHFTNCRVRHSEALFEDEAFPERELAALVAAKVYYQLQEYDESMGFALGAGKLFDIHHSGEFEETILGESSFTNRWAGSAVSTWFCIQSLQNMALPLSTI